MTLIFWGYAPHFAAGGDHMEITSAAFKDGGRIPIQYVMVPAGGKNLSIPLAWGNPPAGTKSFALSIVDPIPLPRIGSTGLSSRFLPQRFPGRRASRKSMPVGAVELRNSFGDAGYGGPQPPKGSGEHPYVVTLYALNVEKLDLGASASLPAFKKALEGKVIQSAMITGKYDVDGFVKSICGVVLQLRHCSALVRTLHS